MNLSKYKSYYSKSKSVDDYSLRASKMSFWASWITIIAVIATTVFAFRVQSIFADLKKAQDRETRFRMLALVGELERNRYIAESIISNPIMKAFKEKNVSIFIGERFTTSVYDANPGYIVFNKLTNPQKINSDLTHIYLNCHMLNQQLDANLKLGELTIDISDHIFTKQLGVICENSKDLIKEINELLTVLKPEAELFVNEK